MVLCSCPSPPAPAYPATLLLLTVTLCSPTLVPDSWSGVIMPHPRISTAAYAANPTTQYASQPFLPPYAPSGPPYAPLWPSAAFPMHKTLSCLPAQSAVDPPLLLPRNIPGIQESMIAVVLPRWCFSTFLLVQRQCREAPPRIPSDPGRVIISPYRTASNFSLFHICCA